MKNAKKAVIVLVLLASAILWGYSSKSTAKTPTPMPEKIFYKEGTVTGFGPEINVNGHLKVSNNNVVEILENVSNISLFKDELIKAKERKVKIFFDSDINPVTRKYQGQIRIERIEFL